LEEALFHRIKADGYINIMPSNGIEHWKIQKATSKNQIGVCYENLNHLDSALSYYIQAIELYKDSVKKTDRNLAFLIKNAGNVLGKKNFFDHSNQLLLTSIEIFRNDSVYKDNSKLIGESLILLARNGLKSDKINDTKKYLEQAKEYLTEELRCEYLIYKGSLSMRNSHYDLAISTLKESAECFKNEHHLTYQNVAEAYFTICNIYQSMARYDSAKVYLEQSMAITNLNYDQGSVKVHDHLQNKASYLALTGNYFSSNQVYSDILKTYQSKLGLCHKKLITIYSSMAANYREMADYAKASQAIDSAISIGQFHNVYDNAASEYVLIDIANTKYSLGELSYADSVFNYILEITEKETNQERMSIALALNGLGLIALDQNNYKKADSLFLKSISVQISIFPNGHPNTAITKMNYARLQFAIGNLSSAEKHLNESMNEFIEFKGNKHPTLADINISYSELLLEKSENRLALKKLNSALEILMHNFPNNHPKTLSVSKRINKLTQVPQ
jgi:hypothetical protein